MLCIAVLHHISTVERRVAMLAELARVLRCGGRAVVTVWASEQEQPGKLAKWEPIGPGEKLPTLPNAQSLGMKVCVTTSSCASIAVYRLQKQLLAPA